MKNKIIIVGDSYAYGHGLPDRVHYYDQKSKSWIGQSWAEDAPPSVYCWASLAGRDFTNFEFLNVSIPGNSNDNMFINLLNEIDDRTALVIFAGSMPARTIIKHHTVDEMVVPWIVRAETIEYDKQPKAYAAAKENFVKHLYNNKIGNTHSSMAIIAAWAVALLHQAKFAWCVPRLESDLLNEKGLTIAHIKEMSFPSIINYEFAPKFGPNWQDFEAADGHINEYGHKLYYEAEIKPLLTRLLS